MSSDARGRGGLVNPTSFQRKVPNKTSENDGTPVNKGVNNRGGRQPPPGTRPSIYTHHVLASTGVPDLDNLLGGGIPVGSALMILEDEGGGYSKLLLKYFLSEGLFHKNNLFVAGVSTCPDVVINSLPSWDNTQENSSSGQKSISGDNISSDEMKIAWRYKHLPSGSGQSIPGSGTSFNLLKTVSKEIIGESDITRWNGSCTDLTSSPGPIYNRLLKDILETCSAKGCYIDPTKARAQPQGVVTLMRLGIFSLGDILWWEDDLGSEGGSSGSDIRITTFLLGLRAILRSSICASVITVPHSVHSNPDLRHKLLTCADYAISLKSFDGEKVNIAYKDYHGIIRVEKIGSLGLLSPPPHLLQDENELVFRSRRNGFKIERFHLPPDLSSTASRDNVDPKLKSNTAATKINIDF